MQSTLDIPTNDLWQYLAACDEDNRALMKRTYGDTLRAVIGCCEVGYWNLHHLRAPWGVVIEQIEESINGDDENVLFIHYDPAEAR
jgi:hypothetical protein